MASPCTGDTPSHHWGANEAEISFQIFALAGAWNPDLAV